MPAPRDVNLEPIRAARELGPLLAANADAIEQRRELPPAVVSALAAHDFFRLLVPREIGGGEVEPTTLIEVIEAIAKHDASTAWCVGQNTVSAMIAAYMEPGPAREIFGHASGVVAWGPPSQGEARAVDGGYTLNGRFNFASGSRHAGWLGAHVPVIDADGTKRSEADGSAVVHTLMFPKSKAEVIDTWHVMGLRGTGSDSYVASDVFVPSDFAVRRGSDTRPRSTAPLFRFGPSSLYAASFAAVALGIARSSLDALIEIARDKVPRGVKRPLRENNRIQFQVGEAEAKWRSARAFVLASYADAWRGAAAGHDLEGAQYVSLRLATTWAIRQSAEVVRAIYSAAGATAVFTSNPFERRFRDIHTVTQQIQGHESNLEAVGQVILGVEPERRMFTF